MDTEHARTLLARERERAQGTLNGRGPDAEGTESDTSGPSDIASGMVETEVDEAVAESARERLAAIERAEQRLEDGSYGLSVESGEPIPDARLEVTPWAERTIEEQGRFEHGG